MKYIRNLHNVDNRVSSLFDEVLNKILKTIQVLQMT